MFLGGSKVTRGDTKRRNLAATTGYIGEAGGAETGKKASELSAEQVRSEIHQHVAVIDLADVRDVRKDFATDRDAFLDDPHPVLCRKRKLDRRVPGVFSGFPAEGHSGAAILIAGLKDQVFALLTDKAEQLDGLAVVPRLDARDNPRPGNTLTAPFPFAAPEK